MSDIGGLQGPSIHIRMTSDITDIHLLILRVKSAANDTGVQRQRLG